MRLYVTLVIMMSLTAGLAMDRKINIGNAMAMIDVDDLAKEIVDLFGSNLDACETDSCPSLLQDIEGNSFMKTLLCISACQQARVMRPGKMKL